MRGNGIPNTRVTRCWAETRWMTIDEEILQNSAVRASTKYVLGYDSTSSWPELCDWTRGDNRNFSMKTNVRQNILLMNKQGFADWMTWIVRFEHKSEEIYYLRTWRLLLLTQITLVDYWGHILTHRKSWYGWLSSFYLQRPTTDSSRYSRTHRGCH